MRVFSGGYLLIREKNQEKVGLIILPDNKNCSSKNCTILAAGKVKLKKAIVDNELQAGDRALVLQYDNIPIKAWKDLEVRVDQREPFNPPDASKLPDGVTLTGGNCAWTDNQGNGAIVWFLKIKKGTPLQIVYGEHIQGQLLNGFSVDDQKIG